MNFFTKRYLFKVFLFFLGGAFLVALSVYIAHKKRESALHKSPVVREVWMKASFAKASEQEWRRQELQGFVSEEDRLEKKCWHTLEYGTDYAGMAQAHETLYDLYVKRGDWVSLYKALRHLSQALDLGYTDKRAQKMAALVLEKGQKSFQKGEIGFFTAEKNALRARLPHTKNPKVFFCQSLRLSWIFSKGQASSLEKAKQPDVIKALRYRRQALSKMPQVNKTTIPVVMIFDSKYAPHGATTVATLLMNAEPDTQYDLYFMMDPDNALTEDVQKKLLSMTSMHPCQMRFIPFDLTMMQKSLTIYDKRFKKKSRLLLFRVFLPKVLPDLEKLIYLDGDVLVYEDLKRLYHKKMDGYDVAGVRDTHTLNYTLLDGKNGPIYRSYFNCGILVMNLASWRMRYHVNKVPDIMADKKRKLGLFDQDIINILCRKSLYELSPRWNLPIYEDLYEQRYFGPYGFHPFIRHMYLKPRGIKAVKPWKDPKGEATWRDNPQAMEQSFWDYWAYRDITPWSVHGQS